MERWGRRSVAMVLDRSPDASASGRKLADTPEKKLIRLWIWEYVLKYSSDLDLITELSDSLPFPEDFPRLIQMLLIRDLSDAHRKGLGIRRTLCCLESLQQSFEDPDLEPLSNEFEPLSFVANGDESVWKVLRRPTLELKEELRKLLCEEAGCQSATGIESKLSTLTKTAWTLFGPLFLERTEAAVISGKYMPQGVSIHLPLAGDAGAVNGSGANLRNGGSVVELQEAVKGTNETLRTAQQELADSRAELEMKVKDPLPELLRNPDGGAPGVRKRSLMDPHPSAQAEVWVDHDEIEESPSPLTPSASNRIRLPDLRSPNRRPVGSPVSVQAVSGKPRRLKRKWSEEEVEVLKREVQKFGKGRWKAILQNNEEAFYGRTEVDIKDKWRNLERYSMR